MRNNIDAFKARIEKAREERGATDPILVIAAIAVSLVLLVGGSFAVSGMISSAKDLNAKSDLDKVSVAEVAAYAAGDAYLPYATGGTSADSSITTPATANTALQNSGVGFNPTAGDNVQVVIVGDGWVAMSESSAASHTKFYRSSATNYTATSLTDAKLVLPTDPATGLPVLPTAVTFQ